METNPDMIIPNWAFPINKSDAVSPYSARVIALMAAIYEKLEP